jgi:hypothetical protein
VRKGNQHPDVGQPVYCRIVDAPGRSIYARQEGVARIVQAWHAEVERMLREVIVST